MEITKQIKLLLVEKDMTATQLAEAINMTQSNLSKKMKNGTYTVSDLENIANALNVELVIEFKK